MIVFHQFPWSPYCLVQRRILEYGRIRFRSARVPAHDRSAIWKLSKEQYYQVPILTDGRKVLYETGPDSQVIAKYLDDRFGLELFPAEWGGVQDIVWRYLENDVEGVTFRLNDAHWKEFVPRPEQWAYVRHKERRFGRACLDDWHARQSELLGQLTDLLGPAEQMLATRAYLLAERALFVDFSLWGMLANFLYSGHYELPASRPRISDWYGRMSRLRRPIRS